MTRKDFYAFKPSGDCAKPKSCPIYEGFALFLA